jgi:hypothetical protein
MDADTITQESGPGWRELVENLHDEIQVYREREAVLLRLLEQDREALVYLSKTGRPRPNAARPPGEPSPLHRQIFAVLREHPAGCTRAQIEAALETTQPLGDVLIGMCRRGHLIRLGKGLYALPPGPGMTQE